MTHACQIAGRRLALGALLPRRIGTAISLVVLSLVLYFAQSLSRTESLRSEARVQSVSSDIHPHDGSTVKPLTHPVNASLIRNDAVVSPIVDVPTISPPSNEPATAAVLGSRTASRSRQPSRTGSRSRSATASRSVSGSATATNLPSPTGPRRFFHLLTSVEGISGWLGALEEAMAVATALGRTMVLPCVRAGRLVACEPGSVIAGLSNEETQEWLESSRNLSWSGFAHLDAAQFPAVQDDCKGPGYERLPRGNGASYSISAYFSAAGIEQIKVGALARLPLVKGLPIPSRPVVRTIEFNAWHALHEAARSSAAGGGAAARQLRQQAQSESNGDGAARRRELRRKRLDNKQRSSSRPTKRPRRHHEESAGTMHFLSQAYNLNYHFECEEESGRKYPAPYAPAYMFMYGQHCMASTSDGRETGIGLNVSLLGSEKLAAQTDLLAVIWRRSGTGAGTSEHLSPLPDIHPLQVAAVHRWMLHRGLQPAAKSYFKFDVISNRALPPSPSLSVHPSSFSASDSSTSILGSRAFTVVQWRSETLQERFVACAEQVISAIKRIQNDTSLLSANKAARLAMDNNRITRKESAESKAAAVVGMSMHQPQRQTQQRPEQLAYAGDANSAAPATGESSLPLVLVIDISGDGNPCAPSFWYGREAAEVAHNVTRQTLLSLPGVIKYDSDLLATGALPLDAGLMSLREYVIASYGATSYATCNGRFNPRVGKRCRVCSWVSEFISRVVLRRQRNGLHSEEDFLD